MVSSFITSTYVSINVIIWSICIGANLAVLFGYFSKNYTGVFIRRLLDQAQARKTPGQYMISVLKSNLQ